RTAPKPRTAATGPGRRTAWIGAISPSATAAPSGPRRRRTAPHATMRVKGRPMREIAPSAAIDRIVKPRRSATTRLPIRNVPEIAIEIAIHLAGSVRVTPAADRSAFSTPVVTLVAHQGTGVAPGRPILCMRFAITRDPGRHRVNDAGPRRRDSLRRGGGATGCNEASD